jgi:hypothetical protein
LMEGLCSLHESRAPPCVSLGIAHITCMFIAREIYKIIRHTVNALIDAVPPDIDYVEVRNDDQCGSEDADNKIRNQSYHDTNPASLGRRNEILQPL